MQPSDSLIPFGLGYGLPLPSAYLVAGACSVPHSAAGSMRIPQARYASETDHRLSAKSGRFTRRSEGLPGFWAVLFKRAVVVDPAGCGSLLAHGAETAAAFRLHEALGTQNERRFVAAIPTAHSLAHLRIDERVAASAARLATGMGGLAPHRAGFAPAGRQTKFHDFIASSILFDQLAWPHHAPTTVLGWFNYQGPEFNPPGKAPHCFA